VDRRASLGPGSAASTGGAENSLAGLDGKYRLASGRKPSTQASDSDTGYHPLTDHLGSVESVTDHMAQLIVKQSYEAFGSRRGPAWQGTPTTAEQIAIANTGRRGFTDHTMLDNLFLVHMNGRVYDPVIGRFMSADPYVDGELDTQGWNRYSYVKNNPLSFVDPSGYGAEGANTKCNGDPCPPEVTNPEGIPEVTVSGKREKPETLPSVGHFVWTLPTQIALSYGEGSWQTAIVDWTIGDAYAARDKVAAGDYSDAASSALKFGFKVLKAVDKLGKAAKATAPYVRPSGATTAAQRASVQGKPCVKCGAETSRQVAGHKEALVKEHYEKGGIDRERMRSVDAVQPECPTCSAREGAEMSRYSREQRQRLGE
jgi:RHS repeat-associated protein